MGSFFFCLLSRPDRNLETSMIIHFHLLKTKEDLEQFEKESALLALDPRATSRERREWQRMGGENKVHALRHRQDVQTAKEKLANVYVRCKNNVNYTNEDVLEATVHLDDDSWTVHEMATACLGRHISTGHRLMTYVDEIVYYESILTKGIVLEMVTSSAWQAAGRAVCVAHSTHLRRLCSATHRPLLGWP